MQSTGSGMWLRRTEFLLLVVGTVCAGYFAMLGFGANASRRASAEFGAGHSDARAAVSPGGPGASLQGVFAADTGGGPGGAATVMGRLEIAEIQLSVPILSDYESASLLKGVGHIPGTAMPGGLGTLGLAGHRDTYFRQLRNIRKDMTVRVLDHDGGYSYVVDSTEVVKPEKVEVLDIGSRPGMTLITCYPFNFVGAAPLRFIVHAHLVSAAPDAR